ncbi:unnamed protein product [Symbiodinium microadriaticum]|nr:unnamed protein product [Symbiodinium microadriaticum]CAE7949529.1 unnamed protein product [Symbiodinium sp. KB8]
MQPHEFGIVREQVVLDAHGVILEEGAGAWQPPELLASINRLNLLLAQKRTKGCRSREKPMMSTRSPGKTPKATMHFVCCASARLKKN